MIAIVSHCTSQITFIFTDWASMATISVRDPTKGFPFSNVISMSDGTLDGKSTGIPYMYMTDMEMSTHDLHVSLITNSSEELTIPPPPNFL